jgi:hypothetical protein
MEDKYFYVIMEDVSNNGVFHTVKLSQKQALGLGHSGYGGHATDQSGRVWKWDAQKATHVLVNKLPVEEITGHQTPLKPHIENQEKEIDKHIGALKQDIAEKKEEMTEKKSFSDKYVPFRKKEDNGEHSTKVYDKEDVKVGQHLVGTYGGASQVMYKITKIEKSQNPQRDSDRIHTVDHRGQNDVHLASDINRSHGPSIGIRTESLHEKHYNKMNAASQFESWSKDHKEDVEETAKNKKIAEGNVGKEVVYHDPNHNLHGKTGKIVSHDSNRYGSTYNIDVDNENESSVSRHNDFNSTKGWMEKSKHDSMIGKGSFDKVKSAHLEKSETKNKPDANNMKEIDLGSHDTSRSKTLVGAGGKFGAYMYPSHGGDVYIRLHDNIENIGKRGKTVKQKTMTLDVHPDSRNAHDHNLSDHLIKTNPKTYGDAVKEVHNYVNSHNEKHKDNPKEKISINHEQEYDERGIDVNQNYGQTNYKKMSVGNHTSIQPDPKTGKVNVVDLNSKTGQDGSGYVHHFPLSHYSRLEGIKGELDKTKSHDEVMTLLRNKKFKTTSFYSDPWR